jgi:hypothetical protein
MVSHLNINRKDCREGSIVCERMVAYTSPNITKVMPLDYVSDRFTTPPILICELSFLGEREEPRQRVVVSFVA